MALAKKLKHFNLFNDSNLYGGIAKTVTLPKLGRKMEAYRGGGMDGLSDHPSKLETNQGKLRICAGGAMSLVSTTSTASNFLTDFTVRGLESSFSFF